MSEGKALNFYEAQVAKLDGCPNCNGPLGKVDYYGHDGGWLVAGFLRRQWLSARCEKCHYDWSLWKLGILGSVEHPEVA